MPLPNPSMGFTPFDTLPASDLNDLVENIEALAAGTGLNNGVVGPTKRTGGFYIGSIAGATLGSTGNKAITGVGFIPKLVRFTVLGAASNSAITSGVGAMTPAGQYYSSGGADGSTGRHRNSSTSACIGWGITTTTPSMLASYVSMDADGFTINVSIASSSFPVAYEAYA